MRPIKIRNYKNKIIKYNEKGFYATQNGKICSSYKIRMQEKKEEEREEKAAKLVREKINKTLDQYKFEFNALELKDFTFAIQEMLTEPEFTFTKIGLEVVGMDPANVLMLRRVVQYTKQKAIPPFKILINANNLYACMRRFISKSKKETVVLSFTKDKDQNIELNFKAEYGHFRIKSLPDYGDQREQKIPELKYSSKIKLSKDVFKRNVELVSIAADSGSFRIEEKKFVMVGDDDDHIFIKTKPIKATGKDAKAKFSLEYLKKMRLEGVLKLEYNSDYPLKVSDEKGNWYILAPRVDN